MGDVIYGCRLLVLTKLDSDKLPESNRFAIADAEKGADNSGTGSLASSGTYTGDVSGTFEVEITVANTVEQTITDAEFRCRFNKGSWTENVVVTGPALTLKDGVQVTFSPGSSGQDFVVGDKWEVDIVPNKVAITTPQQFGVTPQISDGQRQEGRGGDRLLAAIEDDDELLGMDLSFTDALLSGDAMALVTGGRYKYGDTFIPPKIGSVKPSFQSEVYVARYAEASQHQSDVEGYILFAFYDCKGRIPTFTAQDRNFLVPQFAIKARENKKQGLPLFNWQKIDSLPS